MTKLLEQAVETARAPPNDMQDDIARMMLSLAGHDDLVIQLSPAEEKSLAASLEQANNRKFATDDQVQAVWTKHGP